MSKSTQIRIAATLVAFNAFALGMALIADKTALAAANAALVVYNLLNVFAASTPTPEAR